MTTKEKSRIVQRIMLDVGCGYNCQAGYVGMDKRDIPGVQIVHDVEVTPWPLDDESCSVVVMSHLIEHIKPWHQFDVINEAWRVLCLQGLLLISTPYANSFGYCQDPTHVSSWNEATPEYFTPGFPLYEVYRPKPWHKEKLIYDKKLNIELALRKISEKEGEKKRRGQN